MRAGLGLLLLVLSPPVIQASRAATLDSILARLAEEAAAFARSAPDLIATETLEQRSLDRSRRFRPRIGAAALKLPPLKYQQRRIVSEYSYSTFQESPNAIHEFREVVSVDGREVRQIEEARQRLTVGLRSADDKLKRKLLEEFEKHGLKGAAVDFGQVVLLFTRAGQADFDFEIIGHDASDGEERVVLSFGQKTGDAALTIIHKNRASQERLTGRLWVGAGDLRLRRVHLRAEREDGDHPLVDEATVDYAMSPHGVVTPALVVHSQSKQGVLIVENRFRYSEFRKFGAETEVEFKPLAEPAGEAPRP